MKKFGVIAVVAGLFGMLSGCQSGPSAGYLAASNEISFIRQTIRNSRDPHAFVVNARKYALEKVRDISDAEIKVIKEQNPVIENNFDGTEFSFTWTIAKHHLIEVVTTLPPCQPIAAYRVRRTFYP